jgi:hypothetical protein
VLTSSPHARYIFPLFTACCLYYIHPSLSYHSPVTNMRLLILLALVASSTLGSASLKGFNHGAFFHNATAKQQSDFEAAFNAAKALTDAPDYNSARLFTTIQNNTVNTPTSAIQAAINTNTSLLLGLWCSAGDAVFENELIALKAAITQYGQPLSTKSSASLSEAWTCSAPANSA